MRLPSEASESTRLAAQRCSSSGSPRCCEQMGEGVGFTAMASTRLPAMDGVGRTGQDHVEGETAACPRVRAKATRPPAGEWEAGPACMRHGWTGARRASLGTRSQTAGGRSVVPTKVAARRKARGERAGRAAGRDGQAAVPPTKSAAVLRTSPRPARHARSAASRRGVRLCTPPTTRSAWCAHAARRRACGQG